MLLDMSINLDNAIAALHNLVMLLDIHASASSLQIKHQLSNIHALILLHVSSVIIHPLLAPLNSRIAVPQKHRRLHSSLIRAQTSMYIAKILMDGGHINQVKHQLRIVMLQEIKYGHHISLHDTTLTPNHPSITPPFADITALDAINHHVLWAVKHDVDTVAANNINIQ
jgi:hypothetical protein